MGIKLSDSLRIGQQKAADDRYLNDLVPYTSVNQAKTLIPFAQRYAGLTVNIAGVEYWWPSNTTDLTLDPIVKKGGGDNVHKGVGYRNGSGDYEATLTPPITTYKENELYIVTLDGANTAGNTISFNGLAPQNLTPYRSDLSFAGGELKDGATYIMTYDVTFGIVVLNVPIESTAFSSITGSPNDNVALKAALDLKLDATDYNQHYRGKFISKVALDANVFTPALIAGDYAQVDAGSGTDVVNYNWDADDSIWVEGGSGSGATDTDGLPEGSTNLYFTLARVLSSVLTGLSIPAASAISATDTILQAFGKIQAQINAGGGSAPTIATDGEVSTQTTPTEDNKFTSRRGLIFHFNWLKTQVVNIANTWSFTKGLFGTTTAKNAHVIIAASTSTNANSHVEWGAAYSGSETGAEWKVTTGYRKYLKRNAVTDEYVFMGANPALAGTGTAIMILAADGSITRGAAIDEEFTLDSDIITAITGATYTAGFATITPSGSKTFRQGESYFDSTTKYKYEAVADNAVIRVIPS